MNQEIKVIFIPGNGGGSTDSEWFPWLKSELETLDVEVISPGMYPDSVLARAEFWLPFIESLGADEHTILLGWSSGAEAAMRYAETHKILGSVLIAAYHTDLGHEDEKASGYFDTPWNWEAIKRNQKWIVQFSSLDDPFIPIEEARFVHEKLSTDYYELPNAGHFYPMSEFPALLATIKIHLL